MEELAPDAVADCSASPSGQLEAAPVLQRWLLLVVEQDQTAFERLYAALAPRVSLLAHRILRNAACAEEVVEECFWQVWRQAARFDPARGSAEAWVLTLARSRALDAYRARSRAQADVLSLDALDEGTLALLDSADDQSDAARLLQASRHDKALHAAVHDLPALPRQLVAMAFFRGLTHEEIAQQTGLPLGSVKSHIRRGLGQLQQVLTAEGLAP